MVEHFRPRGQGGEASPNAGVLAHSEWGKWQEEEKEKKAGRVYIGREGFVSQWESVGYFSFSTAALKQAC